MILCEHKSATHSDLFFVYQYTYKTSITSIKLFNEIKSYACEVERGKVLTHSTVLCTINFVLNIQCKMYASNYVYSFIGTSSSSMASTQNPLPRVLEYTCFFRAERKTNMAALSESEWLRHIRHPFRTEFDQT